VPAVPLGASAAFARLTRVLGAVLGWLAGSVLRIRRAHVEESMRAAGLSGVRREAGAMYAALGTSAVEFLWMACQGARALEPVRIEEGSIAPWNEALARGRGVVIAASHTGNWDLAACAMAQRVELLVVTKRLHVRWLDRFWQSTRAALGVRLAEGRGAMATSREVLRRGGAVAMMIDQVPGAARHAMAVEFLGRPALADRAPATLAAVTGAPLVVAAARRDERGRHWLHVLDVLQPPRRGSRAWIGPATRAATVALDRFVRAHPSQWLWLHRRWKSILPAPCPPLSSSRSSRRRPVRPPTPSSSPAEASRAA
jgi:KDO2-lipid IV(A) lauroyltransferase